MNVHLTPEQEQFVKRLIAEGRFPSEAEVIREGLGLLAEEIEWRADARRKIANGMEQLRVGQVIDGEQAVEDVLRDLRSRHPRAKGA